MQFWREEITSSTEETLDLGCRLGQGLQEGDILCLFGELGAGKTTLMKGLIEGVGGVSPSEVTSPTFSYLHIYPGEQTIYHFDLYRLNGLEEFLAMGFHETFSYPGICCIEWAEKIESLLPESAWQVEISALSEEQRRFVIRMPREHQILMPMGDA